METGQTKGAGEMAPLLKRYYATPLGWLQERTTDQIVCKVRRDVYYFLGRKGVRGDDLDDLCAEVCSRLLTALRRSREPHGKRIVNIAAYGIMISKSVFVDWLRSRGSHPPVASMEELLEQDQCNPDSVLPPAQNDVEAEAVGREWLRNSVWPAICTLPPLQRAALLLSLTPDELLLMAQRVTAVAEALNMPLEAFLPLWRELPLSDRAIGEHLAIRVQGRTSPATRISNLRKTARISLQRRLG